MNARPRAQWQSKSRSTGQILVVFALSFVVILGFVGLAIDAGHDYLVHRNTQNAVDAAALAAGYQLTSAGATLTAPPLSGAAAIHAAHDYVQNNGFPTTYNSVCDTRTATAFSTNWYDAAVGCSATSGYTTKVTVNVPAVASGGRALPPDCVAYPYNCIQVVISYRITNYIMGIMGISTTTAVTSSVAFASPPASALGVPPAIAVYLYQPQSGCNTATQQCFDETQAPSRQSLSCAGSNCPTFWATDSTQPMIKGIDGATLNPQSDTVAMESNGDMVVQKATTVCDSYASASCTTGHLGAQGFALKTGSTLYCTGSTQPVGLVPCSTPGPGGASLNTIAGTQTTFSPSSWTPAVTVPGSIPVCGGLVLNGDAITSSSFVGRQSDDCLPSDSEQYTIEPGKYSSIVINHGQYEFGDGLFDITDKAPVNTNWSGTYVANGIDHTGEKSSDFDLCTGNAAALKSCTLTAGVWIGNGGGYHGKATDDSNGTCVNGSMQGGSQGGGGDATDVSGGAVVFRFESNAGGFVSTGEVDSVALTAPGLGELSSVESVPLLFDLENNSFIHLDASTQSSNFSGIIYQTNTATAGGVELNTAIGTGKVAAITGQLFAYTLTTFGGTGSSVAVDFSKGYGTASTPSTIMNSGKSEMGVITSATLIAGATGTNTEVFVIQYNDEWALDAYDTNVKINGGNPLFFSQGMWSPPPANGSALPPESNTPSDVNPANPSTATASSYGYSVDGSDTTDWTYTINQGGQSYAFETSGSWVWGHQSDIVHKSGCTKGGCNATVSLTFPTPSGTTVSLTVFLTDGDHCGDYAAATYKFNNIGQPAGGQQSSGSVQLEQ